MSVVVSAVLVFALIIMVMSVYLLTIVPDQVREAEAAHMRRVDGSFGDLAHRLSQASGLTAGGQFSHSIDLGTTTVPFFASVESSGRLAIVPGAFFASLACDSANLVARDGAAAPGATFVAASGPALAMADALVVEFQVESYSFGTGDQVAWVDVTDADAALVGTFELRLLDASSSAVVRVKDALGATLAEQVVHSAPGGQIASLRVDALTPIYGFAALIGDEPGVRTFTFDSTTTQVEVYAVGRAADGSLVTKGSGRALPDGFTRSAQSATLEYESSNSRFLDQTYVLEGGALVLSQPTGDFLSLPPFRVVNPAVGDDFLSLSLVTLAGQGQTSGTHGATVSAVVATPVVSVVECTGPVILVTSDHQAAWAQAWQAALLRAGLTLDPVSPGSEFLTVELGGKWFVELTEVRADLTVT